MRSLVLHFRNGNYRVYCRITFIQYWEEVAGNAQNLPLLGSDLFITVACFEIPCLVLLILVMRFLPSDHFIRSILIRLFSSVIIEIVLCRPTSILISLDMSFLDYLIPWYLSRVYYLGFFFFPRPVTYLRFASIFPTSFHWTLIF